MKNSTKLILSVLSDLSADAETQIAKYQAEGAADSMADDFDDAVTIYVSKASARPLPQEVYAIQSLLAKASTKASPFWTDKALRESSDWQEVRDMASRAIAKIANSEQVMDT